MNILIVSATSLEIDPFLKELGKGKLLNHNLSRYKFKQLKVDVLITGVGMVATAFWTGKTLALRKYDAAINAGICGSFDRNLKLGDVVNVKSDFFPEKGAQSGEYFLSLIDLKLLELDEFPFTDGKLQNSCMFESRAIAALPVAAGATVNTIHGNATRIEEFRKRYQADIETMEGAAFFYACFQQNIRCLQLRAVSNYVEIRDTSQWDIPLAISNLNRTLFELLNE
jgi:futalosine hydrolase